MSDFPDPQPGEPLPRAPQAPPTYLPMTYAPLPVPVLADGPAPQNRLTVAFRWILVIPAAVVVFFLGVGAFVIAIIGWFGALFTGRLPRFAADYLSGYVRWSARVVGYGSYLLTDKYPPFTFEDREDYPIRVAFEPGGLNRLAVLFRIILGYPASVVTGVLNLGFAPIIAFVTWLITLINGTMPTSLHQALAAIFRFQIRMSAYWFMLTPTQPWWGLFGDRDDASGAGGPAARWPLVLGTTAKRLVIVVIVLGALITIAADIYNVTSTSNSTANVGGLPQRLRIAIRQLPGLAR